MAEIIKMQVFKQKQLRAKNLCKEGHHQWRIFQEKQFDSISGKLVTVYICSFCGKKKTQLL